MIFRIHYFSRPKAYLKKKTIQSSLTSKTKRIKQLIFALYKYQIYKIYRNYGRFQQREKLYRIAIFNHL